jgi:hypothetical protein
MNLAKLTPGKRSLTNARNPPVEGVILILARISGHLLVCNRGVVRIIVRPQVANPLDRPHLRGPLKNPHADVTVRDLEGIEATIIIPAQQPRVRP